MSEQVAPKKYKRGMHPNSHRSGSQWKPGQSGNPGGNYRRLPKVTNALSRLILLSAEELSEFKPGNIAEKTALEWLKKTRSKEVEMSLEALAVVIKKTEAKCNFESQSRAEIDAYLVLVSLLSNEIKRRELGIAPGDGYQREVAAELHKLLLFMRVEVLTKQRRLIESREVEGDDEDEVLRFREENGRRVITYQAVKSMLGGGKKA